MTILIWQVVVRDDEEVMQRGGPTVYVGNLAPTVTGQMLKEHIRATDPSAAPRLLSDANGHSLGCGLVEFRTRAAADAAVWTLHNTMLEGRMLFLRPEADLLDQVP